MEICSPLNDRLRDVPISWVVVDRLQEVAMHANESGRVVMERGDSGEGMQGSRSKFALSDGGSSQVRPSFARHRRDSRNGVAPLVKADAGLGTSRHVRLIWIDEDADIDIDVDR